MHLEVTFRNLRPREEVRRRGQVLYAKLERFLDPSADASLVITREHGVFRADLTIASKRALHQVHEEHDDLRTALDRSFHRIETAVRRTKERGTARRHEGARRPEGFVREPVTMEEEFAFELDGAV